MKKNQQFCFQHPDRLTFRRCYICHKALCSDCQLNKSHHIFCSNRCWFKFQVAQRLLPIIKIGRRGHIFLSPWTVVAIISILFVWFSLSLNSVHKKLNQIQKQVIFSPTSIETVKSANSKMVINLPAQTKGMVYHNTITISGEADDNSVVMLLEGNKLLQAAQPKNGKFEFENVKLARGQNEFWVEMVTPEGEKIALETLQFLYNSPSLNHLARSINRGNIEMPFIALTFDGGYLNNCSDEILNCLHDRNIKATFFLTGEFVRLFPETVRRIVAEGHEVGNHTMNHPHLTTFAENGRHDTQPQITREVLQQELQLMAGQFLELTGQKLSPIWRAPFGEQNQEICSWAAELGYRQIGWTVGNGKRENMDTLDWVADPASPVYLTADQVEEKILHFGETSQNGACGAIILMHLGSERHDDYPHHKLPEIIDKLQQQGYQFVTVSEMIKATFF